MKLTEMDEFKSLVRTDVEIFCEEIPASVRLVLDAYLAGDLK